MRLDRLLLLLLLLGQALGLDEADVGTGHGQGGASERVSGSGRCKVPGGGIDQSATLLSCHHLRVQLLQERSLSQSRRWSQGRHLRLHGESSVVSVESLSCLVGDSVDELAVTIGAAFDGIVAIGNGQECNVGHQSLVRHVDLNHRVGGRGADDDAARPALPAAGKQARPPLLHGGKVHGRAERVRARLRADVLRLTRRHVVLVLVVIVVVTVYVFQQIYVQSSIIVVDIIQRLTLCGTLPPPRSHQREGRSGQQGGVGRRYDRSGEVGRVRDRGQQLVRVRVRALDHDVGRLGVRHHLGGVRKGLWMLGLVALVGEVVQHVAVLMRRVVGDRPVRVGVISRLEGLVVRLGWMIASIFAQTKDGF